MEQRSPFDVVTVTLNPAIDQTVTVSNFAAGKVNRAAHSEQHAGGKGVNVAAVLADAGHRVAVTGLLGAANSALFEALFNDKRIADHFVRLDGQTRTGIKITDPATQETTDINFPGLTPSPVELELVGAQLAALQTTWVVLAGSLPPGAAPTTYRDLATAARARGAKVILDTSGEPLRHALDAAPQIVKPNIHELEEALGVALPDRAAVIEAARKLLARGSELVVISMGEDGACFVSSDDVVMAKPPRVEVKSTVGAGDAMVAGIVAGQLGQLPLAECARRATAFSLNAITRIGAGLDTPDTIEAFTRGVEITRYQA